MALTKEQFVSFIRKNPVGVGCGVICLGLGLFAYLRADAIPQAEELLQTNTTKVDRLTQNISYSSHLKEQYQELLESARRMEPRIVKASALADNQRYFYKLEAATGAKLIDLRQNSSSGDAVSSKSGSSFYQPVGFTAVIQGDFPHVLAFLREVEGGQHFSRITSVTVSPATGAQQSGDVEVTGSLLTMSINLDLVGVP